MSEELKPIGVGIERFMERLARIPTTEPDEPHLVGDEARKAHEEQQESSLGEHYARCGVPSSIYELASQGGVNNDSLNFPAMGAMKNWSAKDGAIFLLLAGGSGSGKTTAAVEALRLCRSPFYAYDSDGNIFGSWQYDSRRGMFISSVDLAEHASWTPTGESLWGRARKVSLLVLDDLGTEMQTEKGPFLSEFQDLIRRRHANSLRTVVTTNLDSKTFRVRYGARVLDRMLEKGMAFNAGNESKRGRLTT